MDLSRISYTDLLPIEPHSAIICRQTSCGKTVFVLDLLETKYRDHFEHIVILCRAIRFNKSYNDREWIHTDPEVYLLDPSDQLQDYIRTFYSIFARESTLLILDDLSATKALTQKRDMLSELAFSGRHALQSFLMLTQKFNSLFTDVRIPTQWAALFHCKDRTSFESCLDENDVIPKDKNIVRRLLAETKHAKLIMKTSQPSAFAVVT